MNLYHGVFYVEMFTTILIQVMMLVWKTDQPITAPLKQDKIGYEIEVRLFVSLGCS